MPSSTGGRGHSPGGRRRVAPAHPGCMRPILLIGRIVALCAAVVLLSTCAQPTVPLERATITFAYPEPDTPYYERLVASFADQHPTITVELRPQPIFQQPTLTVESVDVGGVITSLTKSTSAKVFAGGSSSARAF